MRGQNDVKKWVEGQSITGLELRQYQLEAWEKLWEARETGHRRAFVHLATALGKTFVAAVDVSHYEKVESKRKPKILFVSHMNDISDQSIKTFASVVPSLKRTIYHSGADISDGITFATFQALHRNLPSIPAYTFDYIIWDEAHHIEASTFRTVADHFKSSFELGLSATPERLDGRNIFEYFGSPVYSKTLSQSLAEGWLSPVDYHVVLDETVRSAVENGFNPSSVTDVKAVFGVKIRDEVIAKEVLKRRHDIGLDIAKTIVFCSTIQAAKRMALLLGGHAYYGDMTKTEKRKVMDGFRRGDISTICTVDMFNEGIDIPDARLLVFLRSTTSRTIFEQQLGRGLRRSLGKTHVTVLDFVANIERILFIQDISGHIANIHESREGGVPGTEIDDTQFGSVFEFEDEVIELVNKYKSLSYEPMPFGRLTVRELAIELEAGRSVVSGLVKRQIAKEDIEYFIVGGRRVIGLTLKQANQIRSYFGVRQKPISRMDETVALYAQYQNLSETGRRMGISATAVRKYLKKAGVPIVGLKNVPTEKIKEAYDRTGSATLTAKEVGLDPYSVRTRLKGLGYTFTEAHKPKVSTEKAVEAYERLCSVRAAAKECGVNHTSLSRVLRAAGYKLHG